MLVEVLVIEKYILVRVAGGNWIWILITMETILLVLLVVLVVFVLVLVFVLGVSLEHLVNLGFLLLLVLLLFESWLRILICCFVLVAGVGQDPGILEYWGFLELGLLHIPDSLCIRIDKNAYGGRRRWEPRFLLVVISLLVGLVRRERHGSG